MPVMNTPAYAQYPRSYSVVVSAANTNTLLYQAGPDGSLIVGLGALATLGGTAANMQFYNSPDGNTTANLLPLSAAIASTAVSSTVALPVTNVTKTDGTLLSPTNPIYLSGCANFKGFSVTQSALTSLSTYYDGGRTQGSANAQTLPFCQNSSGTIYLSTGVTNAIIDFEANFTTTATGATIQPVNATALNIVRDNGAVAQAGDITKGFRYRGWVSGTNFYLIITERLYCAIGAAVQVTFTAWGVDG